MSAQTIYRQVSQSGMSVELVRAPGRPDLLLLGHPDVGSLAIDVTSAGVWDLAAVLLEASRVGT